MRIINTIQFLFLLTAFSLITAHAEDNPVVLFETSAGNFEVTLYPQQAPITVNNFLSLVEKKHYNGTIFHRVIKNFMIQGGGLNTSMKKLGGVMPIENEADNGLKNVKGSIAMARTGEPHSATDQFFINTKDNVNLNFTSETIRGWGYAVFGKVTRGMNIVMQIEDSPTTSKLGRNDVPVNTIEILKISRIAQQSSSSKPKN
jgi:peptidyl-prolyl cis-trans isomerase B (cyclophilin B)